MKFLMFAIIFLLIGAFFIISNNNLHLSNGAEAQKFVQGYFSWFGQIFINTGKMSAYVVKMDWLP